MKYALTVLLLCAAMFAPLAAQTQLELNENAHQKYLDADKELNRVWNELTPRLSPGVKDQLVEAQLRWLKFRDAEADAKAAVYEGGSMAPLIRAQTLTELTRARTQELKGWLDEVAR